MAVCLDTYGIRKLYETVDENGDGKLSVTEMNRYLKRVGMEIPEEDLKYLVTPMSESEEFVGLHHSILGNRSEDESSAGDGCEDLMEAFKVYDMNNDGFISSTELGHVLCNLGFMQPEDLANCQKMICRYDSDSNGLLDFSEFKNMMTSHIVALPQADRHLHS